MSGGSGKGGAAGHNIKTYNQTCKWDLHGNLLSVTPGAPVVPLPLYTTGTQTVFAVDTSGDVAGSDSALPEHGFVNSPGSHYTWLTPMSNAVLQQAVYSLVATLKSDGDTPVNISALVPSALHGVATLTGTTCVGQIKVGSTCSINVTYDPTKLTGSDGLAYDTLRIDLTSDAGAAHDFVQKCTIVLPNPNNDN